MPHGNAPLNTHSLDFVLAQTCFIKSLLKPEIIFHVTFWLCAHVKHGKVDYIKFNDMMLIFFCPEAINLYLKTKAKAYDDLHTPFLWYECLLFLNEISFQIFCFAKMSGSWRKKGSTVIKTKMLLKYFEIQNEYCVTNKRAT